MSTTEPNQVSILSSNESDISSNKLEQRMEQAPYKQYPSIFEMENDKIPNKVRQRILSHNNEQVIGTLNVRDILE